VPRQHLGSDRGFMVLGSVFGVASSGFRPKDFSVRVKGLGKRWWWCGFRCEGIDCRVQGGLVEHWTHPGSMLSWWELCEHARITGSHRRQTEAELGRHANPPCEGIDCRAQGGLVESEEEDGGLVPRQHLQGYAVGV